MKFSIDECKNICQYIENSLEILQDIVVDSPIERAIKFFYRQILSVDSPIERAIRCNYKSNNPFFGLHKVDSPIERAISLSFSLSFKSIFIIDSPIER